MLQRRQSRPCLKAVKAAGLRFGLDVQARGERCLYQACAPYVAVVRFNTRLSVRPVFTEVCFYVTRALLCRGNVSNENVGKGSLKVLSTEQI